VPRKKKRPTSTPTPKGPPARQEPTQPRWWHSPFAAPLAIVLLTLLAYSSAYNRGYIWDDEHYVTQNATLRDPRGLVRIWTDTSATPQYYPLTQTTFWLEYHLWGLHPLGYHVLNVLLHAATALLLGLVLRRLAVPGHWLAAAIFAVHPVHVESVAWITELKNVQSAFFYMLAALAYLTFARIGPDDDTPPPSESRPRWPLYALSLLLFACALLSKTVAGTLPAALALVLWWKRKLTWRHAALLLPMLIAAAIMGRLTAWLEVHHVGAHGPAFNLSFLDRCLIAGRALWFYAAKLAWPSPLIFIYPRWHIDAHAPWQYLFPLAFLALVAALWLGRRRFGRGPLVAVLFFAGSLFPALGFADVYPMLFSFVADHFQYLASIGPIILFAAALTRLLPPSRFWLAPAALLPTLGLLTWSQCFVYDDYETLYRDTLAKNPDAWLAHNNLGVLLELAGRTDEALDEYARAADLAPYDADPAINLAKLLIDRGRPADAIPHHRAAIALDPNDPAPHFQLGRALEATNNSTAAIPEYRQALRLRPNWHDPRKRLDALTKDKT
jgi:tetratricopeptide (TPR) repeat protein